MKSPLTQLSVAAIIAEQFSTRIIFPSAVQRKWHVTIAEKLDIFPSTASSRRNEWITTTTTSATNEWITTTTKASR